MQGANTPRQTSSCGRAPVLTIPHLIRSSRLQWVVASKVQISVDDLPQYIDCIPLRSRLSRQIRGPLDLDIQLRKTIEALKLFPFNSSTDLKDGQTDLKHWHWSNQIINILIAHKQYLSSDWKAKMYRVRPQRMIHADSVYPSRNFLLFRLM